MTPCILWTGILNEYGYARSTRNGKSVFLHRYEWEKKHGPIPVGLTIDHLCRVRNCINTDHMEVVTVRENTLRGQTLAAMNASRTHCVHGHPFTPENTHLWGGKRDCRACNRRIMATKRAKAKEVNP